MKTSTRSLRLLVAVLALTGTLAAFDIPLLWLESPSSRSNPHDPKSPLFVPTLLPTAIPPTLTYTRTITATWTASPTFTDSPTHSMTQSSTETETPTSTASPSHTETSTASPTDSPTPSVTETNTETSTASPSSTETPTFTASPTDTPSPTSTNTPTPVIFEDYDGAALLNPNTYGDTGSSVVASQDTGEFVSGPNSLRLVVDSLGWGAGFNVESNYFNGSSVIDATGMQSVSFQIKTDTAIRFSIRFKEGSPAEAGGDLENWESRWINVPASASWQTVSFNLYQFREDLYDSDCNPAALAPPLSPCATMGNNSLDQASIKRFEINFEAFPGTANVYLDDIIFGTGWVPHNGDWPMVTDFGLSLDTNQFEGDNIAYTDKEAFPCPTSASGVSPVYQPSGGWDGGPYVRLNYTIDPTPDCYGFAFMEADIYLGEHRDVSAYTGIRLRHREDAGFQSIYVYLGTDNDPCVPGFNSASKAYMSNSAWTTETIPFSAFTDSDPCSYVGTGNLSDVNYVIIFIFTSGTHTIDLDDIEFY